MKECVWPVCLRANARNGSWVCRTAFAQPQRYAKFTEIAFNRRRWEVVWRRNKVLGVKFI